MPAHEVDHRFENHPSSTQSPDKLRHDGVPSAPRVTRDEHQITVVTPYGIERKFQLQHGEVVSYSDPHGSWKRVGPQQQDGSWTWVNLGAKNHGATWHGQVSVDSKGNFHHFDRERGRFVDRADGKWEHEIRPGVVQVHDWDGRLIKTRAAEPPHHPAGEKRPDSRQTMASVEALHKAGGNRDAMIAAMSNKTEAEKALMNKWYQMLYGKGIEQELRARLDGSDEARAISIWRSRDGKPNQAGEAYTYIQDIRDGGKNRSPETAALALSSVLMSLTQAQIKSLDKDYRQFDPQGLSASLGQTEIDPDRKQFAILAMKGSDRRTAGDVVRMAELAVDLKDMKLLGLAMKGASQEAHELFMKKDGISYLKHAWSGRDLGEALEIVRDGEASTGRQIRAHQKMLWMKNEQGIENVISQMSDQQRAQFAQGREIAEGMKPQRNEADRKAVAYYRDTVKAMHDAHGDDADVIRWTELIERKQSGFLSQITRARSLPGMLSVMEHMSEADWARLKNERGYFADASNAIRVSGLSDTDVARSIDRLAAKAHAKSWTEAQKIDHHAEKPQVKQGVVEQLNARLQAGQHDTLGAIRTIEHAFKQDPALRERLQHPRTEQEKSYRREFENAINNIFGSNNIEGVRYVAELLATGRGSVAEKIRIWNLEGRRDTNAMFGDIISASPAEQNAVKAVLDADHRAIADNAIKQRKLLPEDKLRILYLEYANASDVEQILKGMNPAQLRHLQTAYNHKYGTNLQSDMQQKFGETERQQIDNLLRRDRGNAEADRLQDIRTYSLSRDGFGSWAVDLFGGTGKDLDRSIAHEVNTYMKAYREGRVPSKEEREHMQEVLRRELENFRDAKHGVTDAAVDAAMAAIAVAGSIPTGGVSLGLLGATIGAGAAVKVGFSATIMGNDYDPRLQSVLMDGGIGGMNAALMLLGPGEMAALTQLGKRSAVTGARLAFAELKTMALREGAEKVMEEGMTKLMSRALATGGKELEGKGAFNSLMKIADQALDPSLQGSAREAAKQTMAKRMMQDLNRGIAQESRNHMKNVLREYGHNMASAAAGNMTSTAVEGTLKIDPRDPHAAEKVLHRTVLSGAFGAAGAAGFTTLFKGLGAAWGFAGKMHERPSGPRHYQIEHAPTSAAAGRASRIADETPVVGRRLIDWKEGKIELGTAHPLRGEKAHAPRSTEHVDANHGTLRFDADKKQYFYRDHSSSGTVIKHRNGTTERVHNQEVRVREDDVLRLGGEHGPSYQIAREVDLGSGNGKNTKAWRQEKVHERTQTEIEAGLPIELRRTMSLRFDPRNPSARPVLEFVQMALPAIQRWERSGKNEGALVRDLQDGLDKFASDRRLTSAKIEFVSKEALKGAQAEYDPSRQVIRLCREDLRAAAGDRALTAKLIGKLYHEFAHHEQVQLVMRRLHEQVQQQHPGMPEDQVAAQVSERFMKLEKIEDDAKPSVDRLVESVIARKDKLSPAEVKRADHLIEDFGQYHVNTKAIEMHFQHTSHVVDLINRLNDPARSKEAVAELTRIFKVYRPNADGLNDAQTEVWQALTRDFKLGDVASMTKELNERLHSLNRIRRALHGRYIGAAELEADYLQNLAERVAGAEKAPSAVPAEAPRSKPAGEPVRPSEATPRGGTRHFALDDPKGIQAENIARDMLAPMVETKEVKQALFALFSGLPLGKEKQQLIQQAAGIKLVRSTEKQDTAGGFDAVLCLLDAQGKVFAYGRLDFSLMPKDSPILVKLDGRQFTSPPNVRYTGKQQELLRALADTLRGDKYHFERPQGGPISLDRVSEITTAYDADQRRTLREDRRH